MFQVTEKELKLHQDSTVCYIYKNKFTQTFAKDKNYRKVRDHCLFTGKYRGAAHSICNLGFNLSKEIPGILRNGSKYTYYFIIKKLAHGFKRQFKCLGENTENYKAFFFSNRKRKTRKADKDGNKDIVTIYYKIKCINSARFMASSSLANNLVEGVQKI